MKVTIDKDFNVKMNLGTDFNLKKQGLAGLSFGETERLRSAKEALKNDNWDWIEESKEELKFAQAENSKLRANVKNALKEAGVSFDYGKIEGSFAKQEWKNLREDEKDFKKGAYVINQENLEKLADFLKNKKGVNEVQVETSYLGNISKYKADHLYMAEVKKVRNSNVYSAQVGAHYDTDKKQFLMNIDGLKKGMDIEKKDDLILKTAIFKNLDSIKEVYSVAGLDNEGNIKNMQKKSDLVSLKENGESVLLTQKYFFGGMKKEEYQNSPDEVKTVLNEINRDRVSALKENFKGASFDKDLKAFVFLKTDNPDYGKKFEEYKANDLKFCQEKTKELEVLRPEVKVKQEVNNFTKNYGNSDFVQSKPQGVALA
jgi:hypothetical protein